MIRDEAYERDVERLRHAAKHVVDDSMVMMHRRDWEGLIRRDGAPTLVTSIGSPFSGLDREASVVAIAASGYMNPDPGMSVARYDPPDYPNVINMDQYTAIQTLGSHPQFTAISGVAGISSSDSLRRLMDDFVFIFKREPEKIADHHRPNLPDRILFARLREERS